MASTYHPSGTSGFQIVDEIGTSKGELHLPKRQKTFHHYSLPAPRHDQYTVAWICALPLEMAASQAMLDDIHKPLSTHTDDINTYVLGSVNLHKVVIACLPSEQYGTNNAAKVMTNMKRTFPSIRIALMVGIGGGVPSQADVRLGDIVVGTRVMQYDIGKIGAGGNFERIAIPRTPGPLLGTAVSALRSKHELGPSRIPSILQQKLELHSQYRRPSSPDRLFQATYDHESSSAISCGECDHSKLVPRSTRVTDNVMIHYGAIASGNQVMKHGTTRDNVARELNVICFEMESAGLMEILPCLPIRGICDYSDSHKNNEWQRYAAAIAAAYATELLEEIPVTENYENLSVIPDPYSLRFEQIDYRKLTINNAHTWTCQWLLSHPDYEAWLDSAKLTQHNGFLWISGKPGAGKSTLMKFAYMDMKRKIHNQHAVTASFFFNARGGYLEKSVIGMYRSLLLQLLEGYPDLQAVWDDPELLSLNQNGCPPLNILKDIFHSAIYALGERSFVCFVDALDECDEQQVVDMVQYFEDMAEQSTTNNIPFRMCFSSRHYPHIFIQQGIRLILEDQSGHAQDLATYAASRFRVEDADLRSQLLNKAAGVFMWIVLVIDILNKEYRRGGMALRKRLAEIPSDLSELFKDILRRDNENMEAFLLCVLWILYARRPLQPKEFYHALWSGLSLKDLVDDQIPDVTLADTSESIDRFSRYVISSSKGLAEITKSQQPTVQFIHESVPDFLIKDKGLLELWPDLEFDWESPSHERLKQCCSFYMNHTSVLASIDKLQLEPRSDGQRKIPMEYPFLEYTSQHILYHSNAAAKLVLQDKFLSAFPLFHFTRVHNAFETFDIRKYGPDASLLYILADKGLSKLIRTWLIENPQIHILGERYRYPLFASLANGHKDTVAAILGLPSSMYNGVDISEELNGKRDFKEYENRTPLSWAAQDGRASIVKLLLQTKIALDVVDEGGRTALSRSSSNGHELVVRLLIDGGADVNTRDEDGWTSLLWASSRGYETAVRLLVDGGADVNTSDEDRWTPLLLASMNGHEMMARYLIDRGAEVNTSNKDGWTPLLWASSRGYEAVVRLLIDRGADVNISDEDGWTPLQRASRNGHEIVVGLLVERGADVNTSDEDGWTPLLWASINGHETVARILLDRGADVNTSDKDGWTPLLWALWNSYESVVRLFVDGGADVKISDKDGSTPRLWASSEGHESVLRQPLTGVGVDINTRDEDGKTTFLWTSSEGHETVARLLIDRGAEVNTSDEDGSTPLLWASINGNEIVARILIDRGADINTSDKDGWTPLLWASTNGHELVASILIDGGTDVNISDKDGSTPILWASSSSNEAVARLLIDRGADVNIGNEDGWTPLLCALKNGHELVAKILIDGKTDVNTSNTDKWTPLLWASSRGYEAVARLLIDRGADVNTSDEDGWTPLLWASSRGYENVVRLLIERGADVNTSDEDRWTPILWASVCGSAAIVRLLIDSGADVNISNKDRWTSLQRASRNGHEMVVRLLVDRGADVNISDEDGWTPLLWASMNGHGIVVKTLIDGGADVNTSDKDGSTPLLWASSRGYENVARLLIYGGAEDDTGDQDGWNTNFKDQN